LIIVPEHHKDITAEINAFNTKKDLFEEFFGIKISIVE